MNKLQISLFFGAMLLFSVAHCSSVQAQSQVFVSGVGDDFNAAFSCRRTAPCKTFQTAHDTLPPTGGEIVAMDTSDRVAAMPLIITKSVNITGEGVEAGITVDSGIAISIDSVSAVVVLRHLTINGPGSTGNGIDVVHAAAVHVESCAIQGFSSGLVVESSASGVKMFVKDTIARNNGSNVIAAGKAVLENCVFENNVIGFEVSQGATATLHNCVLAGNTLYGLYCLDAGSQVSVDGCQISNNFVGIQANRSVQIRVSSSNIINNQTGLSASGRGRGRGEILSRTSSGVATNTVEDNHTDGDFTGTYSAK